MVTVRHDQGVEGFGASRFRGDPPAAVGFPFAGLDLGAEADVLPQAEMVGVAPEVLQGLLVADVRRPVGGEGEVAELGQLFRGDQMGGAVDRGAGGSIQPVAAEVGVLFVDGWRETLAPDIEKLLRGDQTARSGSDDADAHGGDCKAGGDPAGRPEG